MRKIFLSVLFFLALTSCKKVHIPENWLFVDSKYNHGEYSAYVKNSGWKTDDKEYFSEILHQLVGTDNHILGSRNGTTISRSFFRVNDSLNLEYVVFTPESYDNVGLFFLGSGSNVFTIAKELEMVSGYSHSKIYVLNYRGYGKSGGIPSFKTVFDDNSAFFKHAESGGDDINFLIGYSMGSVSATYLSAEKENVKLILMAPLSCTGEVFSHLKRQYTDGWKMVLRPFLKVSADDYLTDISNVEAIKRHRGDLLVIHGTKDRTLPYQMGVKLYSASGSENKRLIPIDDGGHASPFEETALVEIIEFLDGRE